MRESIEIYDVHLSLFGVVVVLLLFDVSMDIPKELYILLLIGSMLLGAVSLNF